MRKLRSARVWHQSMDGDGDSGGESGGESDGKSEEHKLGLPVARGKHLKERPILRSGPQACCTPLHMQRIKKFRSSPRGNDLDSCNVRVIAGQHFVVHTNMHTHAHVHVAYVFNSAMLTDPRRDAS